MFANLRSYLARFREARVFIVNISILISIAIVIISVGVYFRTTALITKDLRDQAASYIDLIVRAHSSNVIGISVPPGENGHDADSAGQDKSILTLRDLGFVSKDVSEITTGGRTVAYRMVGLRPLNPENVPDSLELRSIEGFKAKRRPVSEIDRSSGVPMFRYIAPLVLGKTCLPCHGKTGLREGDIAGAVSVTMPYAEVDRVIRTNAWVLAGLAAGLIMVLLGFVYFMGWRLLKQLDQAQQKLTTMAATDELTGLRNRRELFRRLNEEFQRARRSGLLLGVIVLDLDYFKNINDTYGHPFGDLVLKELAKRLTSGLRQYDIIGRTGGEEFCVICPETGEADLKMLAERLRIIVKSEPMGTDEQPVTLTVSLGITTLHEEDQVPENLFSRADNALYRAKNEGRDRVASL